MNQALYEKLKEVARSRSLITYSDIAPLVGVDIGTSLGQFDPDGQKDKRSFWSEEMKRVYEHWSLGLKRTKS